MARCRDYRLALRRRYRADAMAHACEQFRKQHADNGVILDDENPESFHQLVDAPR